MTGEENSKYGAALTRPDWMGLPMRIGYVPSRGHLQGLRSDADTVLSWTGGPSSVCLQYEGPGVSSVREVQFERISGVIDLMPKGTRLLSVRWQGRPSVCAAISLPKLTGSGPDERFQLDPERGPRFGLLDAHVVDLIHRLVAQAQGREFWGDAYVQSLSLAFAAYVTARYGPNAEGCAPSRSPSLSAAQSHRVEEFVRSHLDEQFGLVEMAAQVGYSPDHFAKLFRETYHKSPYQYVLSQRVERAMTMLRDTTMPIAQIAANCGFSNQGHLSKSFKQRTGLTPGVYRKQ